MTSPPEKRSRRYAAAFEDIVCGLVLVGGTLIIAWLFEPHSNPQNPGADTRPWIGVAAGIFAVFFGLYTVVRAASHLVFGRPRPLGLMRTCSGPPAMRRPEAGCRGCGTALSDHPGLNCPLCGRRIWPRVRKVAGILLMFAVVVLVAIVLIIAGIYSALAGEFSVRRSPIVTGIGAGVMASGGVFMGLAILRGLWVLVRSGPDRVAEDVPLRLLLVLLALAFGGGFLIFVLEMPF